MSKLKQLKDNTKIKSNVGQTNVCKQDVSFSFIHLTTNNNYSLKKCDDKTKASLMNRLEELSKHNIQYWFDKGKRVGFETMPIKDIRFNPNGLEKMSKDEKVIITRFNDGEGRIIFIKKGNCPILHIIGFDTNYKAYNHGG